MKLKKPAISFKCLLCFLAGAAIAGITFFSYRILQNRKIESKLTPGLFQKKTEDQIYVHGIMGSGGNWETFYNDYYGYYIEFPLEWRLLPRRRYSREKPEMPTQLIDFVGPDNEEVSLSVYENIENFILTEWFLKYQTPSLPGGFDIPDEPNAQIGKREAFFTIEPYGGGVYGRVTAVIANKNLIFKIEYFASNYGSGKDVYTQMLETFGFAGEQKEKLDDNIPPIPSEDLVSH